jgi:predicted nuclease of predicted toxin-antitoxin system
MKVLIDECAPRALATFPSKRGHECRTEQEMGWTGKQNGELLNLAEDDFDVLVTIDTGFPYQQNLARQRIAIVLLSARTNRLADLSPLFPARAAAVANIRPCEVVTVNKLI